MPSVVFVFLQGRHVLMEWLPADHPAFPNTWVFPGGKLQDGETPVAGLRRETDEELGVRVLRHRLLEDGAPFYETAPGREAHEIHPFLVDLWMGPIPAAVRDTGRPLAWRLVEDAAASPVACTQRLAQRVLAWVGAGRRDET